MDDIGPSIWLDDRMNKRPVLLHYLLLSCFEFAPICPGPVTPFAHTHTPLILLCVKTFIKCYRIR